MEKLPILKRISDILRKHSGYILGVILGLSLVIINAYIGLSMVRVLLDQEKMIISKGGISLPVIKENDYEKAKQEYTHRQDDTLTGDIGTDPFKL